MPDHVHMLFTPLVDIERFEVFSLARITKAIKSTSAHLINRQRGRPEKVWQEESFDRVLRVSEKLDEKLTYILDNPVRQGLVASSGSKYFWLWMGFNLQPELCSAGQVRTPAPTRAEAIIGVISDTHGLLRPEALAALRGSDHIIHAGDIGDPAILKKLAKIAPVTAIRGNVDRDAWAGKIPVTMCSKQAASRSTFFTIRTSWISNLKLRDFRWW